MHFSNFRIELAILAPSTHCARHAVLSLYYYPRKRILFLPSSVPAKSDCH